MTRFTILTALAIVAAPHAAFAAGDAAKGKAVFARCMVCHATVAGKNGLGPSLAGVMGRKAATVPGFAYSPAMKASGIVWTPATLDTFVTNPRKQVPGTKMAFGGLPTAADRDDLIAYIATLGK